MIKLKNSKEFDKKIWYKLKVFVFQIYMKLFENIFIRNNRKLRIFFIKNITILIKTLIILI